MRKAGYVGLWGASFIAAVGLSDWLSPPEAHMPGLRTLLSVGAGFITARLCLFFATRAFATRALVGDEVVHQVAATVASALLSALALLAFHPAGFGPGFALVEGGIAAAAIGAWGFRHMLPSIARFSARHGAGSGVGLGSGRRARRGSQVAIVGRPEAVLSALGGSSLGGHVTGALIEGKLLPGTRLRGVRVIDPVVFERDLARGRFEHVVIVPPLSSGLLSFVTARCRATGVRCVRIGELSPSLSAMRETVLHNPAVLLGRDPITSAIDLAETPFERLVADTISGKRVLLVGAGGALGAELACEILRRRPAALLLADAAEGALAAVEQQTMAHASCEVDARLFDPRDGGSVARLFRSFSPDVVLHLGGRRHLALAERHPAETVLENLFGTRTLVDTALAAGVSRIVFVSSHSAVNPTSILGATQRGAELYFAAMAARATRTKLVTVRLPALLGASGSMLPQFVVQLDRGLPLTVTHPDVERCFLTVPEACRCVLEALALGESGDIVIPDAGAPVKVMDVARRLTARAGLRLGTDVPVQFTGLRPGERLQEQMSYPDETVSRSRFPGMFVARGSTVTLSSIEDQLDALAEAALAGGEPKVVRALCDLLPEYRPSAEQEYRFFDERDRANTADASVPILLFQSAAQ